MAGVEIIIVRLLFLLLGLLLGTYFAYLAEEIRLGEVNTATIAVGIVLLGASIYFMVSLAPAP